MVANPTLWCGKCPQCLAGWHNRCDTFAILGEHVPGAYAEFVRVPARNLVAIPDGYPDDPLTGSRLVLAAAAPLVGVTAWHMLITAGHVRAGETVLVVGAGGGVNSIAIQIAKLAGATVLVIAADAAKAAKARALGADLVIDRSTEPNWSKAVHAATNRRGVDAVVDNVGAATWGSSLRCLARGGRLLTVGGTTGYEAVTPVNLMFGKHLSIIGCTMGTQADFEAVMAQVWAGRIQPVVDRVFPLAEYPAALARHDGRRGIRENPGSGRMMDAERSALPGDTYSTQTRLRATLQRGLSLSLNLNLNLSGANPAPGNSPARPQA